MSDPTGIDPGDLEAFLQKALEVQLTDHEDNVSEQQLREIASRVGLSDEDWQRLNEVLQEHLDRGRNFLKFKNAPDAIRDLDQAAVLAPYRSGVLHDAGQAHLLNWRETKDTASRDKAESYFERCLRIDSSHEGAAAGLSECRRKRGPGKLPGRPSRRTVIGGAAAAGLVALGGFLIWKGRGGDDPASVPALPSGNDGRAPLPDESSGLTARPADARLFQGRYYRHFTGELTWKVAKARCESMGGHLAVVKDHETLDFVVRLKPPGRRVWLGATDEGDEGNWRWVDGTPMEFTEGWSDRQPFNLGGDEHYMELALNGQFNDVKLEGPGGSLRIHGFICEWPGSSSGD